MRTGSKGIPKKLITCPAHAFRKFSKDKERCEKVICCYHCSKLGHCTKGGGCSRNTLNGYPKACQTYPLTWEEAEQIWFFFLLFKKDPKDSMSLDYGNFLKSTEKYMEWKRKNAKKEKRKRKK